MITHPPVETYRLDLPFDQAEPKVRAALAEAGFGILTEVDVQATLKAKLGAEVDQYTILGACNPALAHGALSVRPEVGAFLPCGVALFAEGGGTRIVLQNPRLMAEVFDDPRIEEVAEEAYRRLTGALASVATREDIAA